MATINDITGDPLISKTNTKAYEDNYDRIFGGKKKPKAPQSLDAAYERRAMEEGLVKNPVFPENKDLNDYPEWEYKESLDW